MGKYQETSIRSIVNKINDKYFLPEIQREFVWDKDKTKFEDKLYNLFDSILRGYPIGTMLFWEVKYKNLKEDNITVLKFIDNSSKEKVKILSNEVFKEKEILLVLDGQQRMTILNLAFNGVFEDTSTNGKRRRRRRYLYMNLLSEKDDEKEVNERVYEFKLIENEKDYFFEDGKLWWNIKKILSIDLDLVEETLNLTKEFNIEENKIISGNLTTLQKAVILQENIYFYKIDDSKSDDEALEIFVRVNSGGVTLTYSDILFSKIKQYWKKGETSMDASEEFNDFIKELNKTGFSFDNDFLLKTSLVLIDTQIAYKIKNFNQENVLKIKDNWESIKKSITLVIDLIKKLGITNKKQLRSNNALIPIIFYVYKNNIKEIDLSHQNFQIIKKYIYSVLLSGVFGGQTDTLLFETRKVIKENNGDLYPINEIFKVFSSKNRPIKKGEEIFDLIQEISYGSDKSRLIFNIIYGSSIGSNFQEDHIFSKAELLKLKKEKKLVNNIGNLQPLGGFTNNSKNNMKFEDWLKDPNRNSDYLDFNLIPYMENYSEDNFEEFIKLRQLLICNRVREFFD